ncbi:MAG TPA: 30S ribosomal protein S2, partial [Thermoleophilia bacterium]|nr:30S ribosomal protein S2 [Thermoleophilia bacterium]
QTRRWNPKMRPYIFTERGGIYIIDLQKTTVLIDEAYSFLRNIASRNGSVLFVGTKKQCQETIKEEAEAAGQPYVATRWLGGLLTNYATLSKRIKRLHELRTLIAEGSIDVLPTRDQMKLRAELAKLETNLGGVAGMDSLPSAVFVVDPRKEAIVVKEARKLGIPIVALVDTNCDPDEVDYIIPGNDDAIRSCAVIIKAMARAVADGRAQITVAEFKEQAEKPELTQRQERAVTEAVADTVVAGAATETAAEAVVVDEAANAVAEEAVAEAVAAEAVAEAAVEAGAPAEVAATAADEAVAAEQVAEEAVAAAVAADEVAAEAIAEAVAADAVAEEAVAEAEVELAAEPVEKPARKPAARKPAAKAKDEPAAGDTAEAEQAAKPARKAAPKAPKAAKAGPDESAAAAAEAGKDEQAAADAAEKTEESES